MNVICRSALNEDVSALAALEQRRWQDGLGMSKQVIAHRIAVQPEGQFVLLIDGEVCGSLYTQLIDSVGCLEQATFEDVSMLRNHSASGKVLQLVSIAVDVDKIVDGGNLLRNYAVSTSVIKWLVTAVVAITRCSAFTGETLEEYDRHVGTLSDPTLYFHASAGAAVKRVVRGYRCHDSANLGCGILIEYTPPATKKILYKRLEADVIRAISEMRNAHSAVLVKPSTPLLTVLDSLHLLSLHSWLEERLSRKLPVEFLFHYSSAEEVAAELAEKFLPSGQKAHDILESTTNMGDNVAIVGLAMNLPGDIKRMEQLWHALSNKHIAQKPKNGRGGEGDGKFLSDIFSFDPDFFGLSVAEAEAIDPSQRLLLECVARAIYDYGRTLADVKGSKVAVYVGMSPSDYNEGAYASGSVHAATGGALSMAAGRISFLLGLHGPSMVIDTACSSSLVALHQATSSLLCHESSLALVAAVNLMLGLRTTQVYKEAGMLSPDGQCHTFDESANGYCRAEGCGAVVLKRLSDAER
ncbi:polyketide synthase, partial [archaeon]